MSDNILRRTRISCRSHAVYSWLPFLLSFYSCSSLLSRSVVMASDPVANCSWWGVEPTVVLDEFGRPGGIWLRTIG